jgi:hypothetical protein
MGLQHSLVKEICFTGLHDHAADKLPYVFEGAESESTVHSAEILLVDLEPIEIQFLKNPEISIGLSRKQSGRGFGRWRYRI